MEAWRQMVVVATCLAVGCAAIGLIEWYIWAYGVVNLEGCAVDSADPTRCTPVWEPTPKPWLAAAGAFGLAALGGLIALRVAPTRTTSSWSAPGGPLRPR